MQIFDTYLIIFCFVRHIRRDLVGIKNLSKILSKELATHIRVSYLFSNLQNCFSSVSLEIMFVNQSPKQAIIEH